MPNIGYASEVPQSYNDAKVARPETELETLLNLFEKHNTENAGFTSRLDSLADKLKSEPIPISDNPNKEELKNATSGLISRLGSLLNNYGRMIGKNGNTLQKLETLL